MAGSSGLSKSPYLKVTLTRHGGHCGFFDTLPGETWLERRLVTELKGESPSTGAQPAFSASTASRA